MFIILSLPRVRREYDAARSFKICAIEVHPLILSLSKDALVVRQAHHEREAWRL